jgi:DNA-binding transcriptional regulator GbsR (MarR family)
VARRPSKAVEGDPAGSLDRSATQRAFTDRMSSIMFETGLPRMPARVFAALLASDPGRMTAAELAEQLRASPAAISGAVRYLAQIGLVSRERESGSRRDHFVLHEDVFLELMSQEIRSLTRWEQGLEQGMNDLGAESPAGRRLASTLDYFEFMRVELTAMRERWREHQARR